MGEAHAQDLQPFYPTLNCQTTGSPEARHVIPTSTCTSLRLHRPLNNHPPRRPIHPSRSPTNHHRGIRKIQRRDDRVVPRQVRHLGWLGLIPASSADGARAWFRESRTPRWSGSYWRVSCGAVADAIGGAVVVVLYKVRAIKGRCVGLCLLLLLLDIILLLQPLLHRGRMVEREGRGTRISLQKE